MRFAAVHRAFVIRGPAFVAPAAALGTWLRLQSYVSSDDVEDPVIRGAAAWSDRQWIAVANVERTEVDAAVAAGLAHWKGDHLEVIGFDVDGLEAIEKMREAGKSGGRGRKYSPPISLPINGVDSPLKAPPIGNPNPSPLLSSPLPPLPKKEEKIVYTSEFEAIWEACGRVGDKFPAFKAWKKSSPPASKVAPAWKAYMASLEGYRNPKHVSTWLNDKGWLEDYRPWNGKTRASDSVQYMNLDDLKAGA